MPSSPPHTTPNTSSPSTGKFARKAPPKRQFAWGRFSRDEGRNPPPGSTITPEIHQIMACQILCAGWLGGKWGLVTLQPESNPDILSSACHSAWAELREFQRRQEGVVVTPAVDLEPVIARKEYIPLNIDLLTKTDIDHRCTTSYTKCEARWALPSRHVLPLFSLVHGHSRIIRGGLPMLSMCPTLFMW